MTDPFVSAYPARLPTDNRGPKTRFLEDIQALAYMASINHNLIYDAFLFTRAVREDDGIFTFNFSERAANELEFVSRDILDRIESINARVAVLVEDEAL